MANKIFVSPGVYTHETDLTFVTRQIGVTTLGMAGETLKGPAFQPIFLNNFDEYRTLFGGLSTAKYVATGYPKYELPYIAKSYFSQSNQLFVTRILGLSGFKAGLQWGITLDAAVDPSTIIETSTASTTGSYSITGLGETQTYTTSDSILQSFIDNGDIIIPNLWHNVSGDTLSISIPVMVKNTVGSDFIGITYDCMINSNPVTISGVTTASTIGTVTHYSGTSYSEVENMLIATLRSRGQYFGNEELTYELTGNTDMVFGSTPTTAETDPLGDFSLTGTGTITGAFNYNLSFDNTKRNYITKILGRTEKDNSTTAFIETFYESLFDKYVYEGKIRGINVDALTFYDEEFDNYLEEFKPAVTPYVVSEVRGNKVMRLFRLWTISDGNNANKEFKVSIQNIKMDDKVFDVVIRSFNDTDRRPQYLEKYSKCNMDPKSKDYVGRRIGTTDGNFPAVSKYVLLEAAMESDTSDAFPGGFLGVPVKDLQLNDQDVISPDLLYKTKYGVFENKRKYYLGLSDTEGIDQDFFDYIGLPDEYFPVNEWTGTTSGFHMDVNASSVTIDGLEVVIDASGTTWSPTINFETGVSPFQSEMGVLGTTYEKVYSRKFTFAPYGGFDGWDVYRDQRTNDDSYRINGTKGQLGLTSGLFKEIPLSTDDDGLTSDYYAYLEGIRTFSNPEATNINVFATPGIDTLNNTNLIEDTIEMVEQERSDSIYITTTPDVSADGEMLTEEDIVNRLDGEFDSNYSSTYWPWIQINDAENNEYIWLPPTRDVVRNIALTDNISFPWFAVAGIQRGDVNAVQVRHKLTEKQRDTLYEGRINPLIFFATKGIKIWGNKTLQIDETALNRMNVRRLLLQTRKLVSAVAIRLIFEQNDAAVRSQFLTLVTPILNNIRTQRGLIDFRIQLDDSPESMDRNELLGKIFIKPTRALEYIYIDFVVTNTGASFDNI